MAISLVVNGVTYSYPETGDIDWGAEATDWAAAITSGTLQKAGGLFQLLAEVDFGTAFGIKSLYLKTRTANVADAGQIRLARADVINWRNQANGANLSLGVSASDVLQFNGANIQGEISVSDTSTIDLTLASNVLSASIVAASIDNSMISASAAIAFSKLASLTSGNILVGSAGNVATSVAMSGDATIIASGALTIANSAVTNAKLADMAASTIKGRAAGAGTGAATDLTATQATAILNVLVGDSGSGGTKGLAPAPAAGDAAAGKFLKADGSWSAPAGAGDVVGPASSTNNGFAKFDGTTGKLLKDSAATLVNADISASAAIAYSKLNLSASIVNADVAAAAAIAVNKLAALTASRAVVSDGSGFLSAATTTATEIGYVNGVTSAIQTQFSGKLPTTITTTGDLIYSSSGTTASRLAIGAAPQVLMPVSGVPAWAWPLSVQTSQTTTYAISANDNVVFLSASGAAFTATLPTAASVAGKTYYLKKTDSTFNAVTIATTSSQTIDGSTTTTLNTQNECLVIVSDGSNWQIIERRIPSVWASYTPTLTGFGTATTVVFYWKRVGDTLLVRGHFVAGTTTATEARISFPSGLTSSSAVHTLEYAGAMTRSAFTATYFANILLREPSVTYFTVGQQSSTTSGFSKQQANAFASSGQSMSSEGSCVISGWNG